MSVTAKQLSKSGARGKEIDAAVREQLQMIDDRLMRATRMWGRNVVACDLPLSFGLPGLEKKNSQRIVYSAILRSLDKRGFESKLLLEPDRTTVYIAWTTDLDTEEVEAMNALIKAKRIAPGDLETFLQKSAYPAPHAASGHTSLTVTEAGRVMDPRGGVALADSQMRASPAPASTAEAAILDSQ